jgi:hypothetical protein
VFLTQSGDYMTTEWTLEDTRLWVHDQYLKLEDMNYYLKSTVEWLEGKGIDNKKLVFLCSFMTIIWVNHLRGSISSKREIFEILEIPNWEDVVDRAYVLPPAYIEMNLEHEELLELVLRNKVKI